MIVAGDKRAVLSDGNVPDRVVTSEFPHGNASCPGPGAVDVSVIMPCLNEEAALAGCIHEALGAIAGLGIRGEVVVVDNGSTDESVRVAREAGARVIVEPMRGYGYACRRGLAEAKGHYLVLGDADGTYDFGELSRFVLPLDSGADMVMGNRLNDLLEPGAMPWLHRRVGNPILTKVINALFSIGVSDAHCGLRSVSKAAYSKMLLEAPGMEFASEFLIEAARAHVRIVEVPIRYRPRAGGEPKLRTFRDGVRHVTLMVTRAGHHPVKRSRSARAVIGPTNLADSAVKESA